MKSDFISKLALKSEASNSKTSFCKQERILDCMLLIVRSLNSWGQNLASLQVDVSIIDKIGRKDGIPSSNALWILTNPHTTPGLESDGNKSFFKSFSEVSF